MRIEIEIPKEFECDYNKDKFDEFFCRVLSDIVDGTTCGRYERETAEMFQKAFEESKIAYDVEAVVAELENTKENFEKDCSYWKEHSWKDNALYNEADLNEKQADCYADAISIVRGKE